MTPRPFIPLVVSLAAAWCAPDGNVLAPQTPNSHALYIALLDSARDRLFDTVVAGYDRYLAVNPGDVAVWIEKCEFVDNALYNEDDDYNLRQGLSDSCFGRLRSDFGDDPRVLIYTCERRGGDSAIDLAERLLKDARGDPARWKGREMWRLYQVLANQYWYDRDYGQVIRCATAALAANDTLGLHARLAEAYLRLSKDAEASRVLLDNLVPARPAWELNEMGGLLLELGDAEHAVAAYRLAANDTASPADPVKVAAALDKIGAHEEARAHLAKAARDGWNSADAHEALFLHDLTYLGADSAWASYQRLRDQGFAADPLAKHRLYLFAKHPFAAWKARDALGILALIAALLLIAVAPYLWVLPLHYLGPRLTRREAGREWLQPFRWGMRHVWLASSGLMAASLAMLTAFDYPLIGAVLSGGSAEGSQPTQAVIANSTLCFIALMVAGTLLLTRKADAGLFWGTIWTKGKVLALAIVTFALSVALSRLVNHVAGREVASRAALLVADPLVDAVRMMNEAGAALRATYGLGAALVVVALAVPLYEETLFRGIILTGIARRTGFLTANIAQSLLFAALHGSLLLMPWYFLFGFVCGIFVRRGGCLGVGIIFHCLNNVLVLVR